MNCKEAAALFEYDTKSKVLQIERCGIGIANYVFIVSTAAGNFVLRCRNDGGDYRDTVFWLGKLSGCEVPVSAVVSQGKYGEYSYLILSYICGDDIGKVYGNLSDGEKRQIAKEVAAIQRKVARLDLPVDAGWTWNGVIDEMLDRSEERIERKHYFDSGKVVTVRKLRQEIQGYLDEVQPTPYLDDISTKNLLIHEGRLSGIIDIDWMGRGDLLTFAAMTRVALLNMELDAKYVTYLLEELQPDAVAYRAFIFYCLLYCVDFMGERGTQFLDKIVPVDEIIIRRLNDIFDGLLREWNECCGR